MRRRSNAIHSESQQEYMLLAEFSQERPGYFYDEKFRQEVDRKLNKHKEGLLASKEELKLSELPGFDYNPEQQEKKEEQAEINLPCRRGEAVLAIIADRVDQAASALRDLFSQPGRASKEMGQFQEERLLDLFIVEHSETLFKIWIIKSSQLDNALLQPYRAHAQKVIDLTEELHDFPGLLSQQIQRAMGGCVDLHSRQQ